MTARDWRAIVGSLVAMAGAAVMVQALWPRGPALPNHVTVPGLTLAADRRLHPEEHP